MIKSPDDLVASFLHDLAKYAGVSSSVADISHDCWQAPHEANDLPDGRCAVYVFSLSAATGAHAGRVLKVGKAGPNSNRRFRYHHYAADAALSTLAGAINNNPILWGYISFPGAGTEIGQWIRENTDRNNFYFKDETLASFFEVYAKALLGPVFEGSLSSNAKSGEN